MKMRERIDFLLLGVSNGIAWLADLEQALKVILLLVSIGYAVHRWWHWNKNKDKQKSE